MNITDHQIEAGQTWRHYKNKDYRIIALSRCTQNLSWYVVYEALYENDVGKIWHRPLNIFLESIEIDGIIIPRFRQVK